jgi:FkbM family methyltransferase
MAGNGKTLGWKDRVRYPLRDRLLRFQEVDDGDHRFSIRCESLVELRRATTALTKEEGTVRWIRTEVKPGDVFYDIGANIGLYTLMAAPRVSPGGRVVAFEPHIANLNALMHNIMRNGLMESVRVVSSALHDRCGFFDFNYHHWLAGSSLSQLDSLLDDQEQQFTPMFTECKYGVTVDSLLEQSVIAPPDHIKIDVDGNELLVLRGMTRLLNGANRPRTLQIEVNRRARQELEGFMESCGYELADRHYTQLGKAALAAGKDVESVHYNGIFRPRAAA